MKEGYTEYIYKLYFRINAEHCYGPISSSAIQHVETLLLVSLTLLLIAAAAKLLQSCLTLQPHRQQPTMLLCPWDSPGKNTKLPNNSTSTISSCPCRRLEFNPRVRKKPLRRKWQPTPVSFLENSMDRGAWRAIVKGITQCWTQLND